MSDTHWIGTATDKMFHTSGQFESTLKSSQLVTAHEFIPTGISQVDEVDSLTIGQIASKIFRFSGLVDTQTVKTSLAVGGIDNAEFGVSHDKNNGHTPWCGHQANKAYYQSGVIEATIKDSAVHGARLQGISYNKDDDTVPLLSGGAFNNDKLKLLAGAMTGTINTSLLVQAVETLAQGISWDGTNTPWCGSDANKLYLQSGQFSGTLKTSLGISPPDADASGIEDADFGVGGASAFWTNRIGSLFLL